MKKLTIVLIGLIGTSIASENIFSSQYYSKHIDQAKIKIKNCEDTPQTSTGNINCRNAQTALNEAKRKEVASGLTSGLQHVGL